jgi:cell pole-organizing protein PopZ
MSALNPLKPGDSTPERSLQEPSMEEILASIRRIISDDQALTPHDQETADHGPETMAGSPPLSASPKWPFADTLQDDARSSDGAKDMRHTAPADLNAADRRRTEPYFKSAPAEPKPFFARPSEAKRTEPKSTEFSDMGLRQRLDDEMERPSQPPKLRRPVEPTPARHEEVPIVSPATDAAVATSFNTLFASQLLPSPEMLAELARDMLRPMLKAWLDDNLPVMVERLVRAEIERVARGGR